MCMGGDVVCVGAIIVATEANGGGGSGGSSDGDKVGGRWGRRWVLGDAGGGVRWKARWERMAVVAKHQKSVDKVVSGWGKATSYRDGRECLMQQQLQRSLQFRPRLRGCAEAFELKTKNKV